MDKLDRRLDQVILQSSHFQERIQVNTYPDVCIETQYIKHSRVTKKMHINEWFLISEHFA